MSHIFISYSRKDLAIAEKIINALAKDDLEPWIDWKSIPKGEQFWSEIQQGIEEADVFLFLVSPDSVRSDWCNREIDHAVKNGKRILPIVLRDTDPKSTHPEISKRNWIICHDEKDDFDKSIEEMRKTIHTDYAWLKYHTELQVKALKWEKKKDNSRLLRGKELREAEQQLAEVGTLKDPQPIKIQREYILASQRSEVRQRRQVTIGLSVGLIMVAMLAVFAWAQRNIAVTEAYSRATAESNAVIKANAEATARSEAIISANTAATAEWNAKEQAVAARIGELTARSALLRETQLDLALLLSVEVFKRTDSAQTKGLLFDNVRANPNLEQFLINDNHYNGLAFSPDGRFLASGERDGSVILWNLFTFQPSGIRFIGLDKEITKIAFSRDGRYLVASSSGKTKNLMLWDTKMPTSQGKQLTGHQSLIMDVAFSQDAKYLVSAGYEGEIILWDLKDLSISGRAITGNSADILSISISPDGRKLATGSRREIILWEMPSIREITRLANTGVVSSLAFSQDGQTLASSNWSGKVMFWDAKTFTLLDEPLHGHSGEVYSIVFSPDGKTLASGGEDGKIILWDTFTRQMVVQPLQGHTAIVTSIAYSPDGKYIASGGFVEKIVLWSTEKSTRVSIPFPADDYFIQPIEINPISNQFFTGGTAGQIKEWKIQEDKVVLEKSMNGPNDNLIESLAVSPDGKMLASGGSEGRITLWDIETNSQTGVLAEGDGRPIYSLSFSPDGRVLASGGWDQTIVLWDIASKSIIQKLTDHTFSVNSLTFSPDGKYLVSTSQDSVITFWDAKSYQKIYDLTNDIVENVDCHIAVNPNSDILAFCGKDYSVVLWDMKTRQQIGTSMKGHKNVVTDLQFSPDGNTIASSSWDNIIILWDIATQQQIGSPLTGHPSYVYDVAFNHDGGLLLSGGNNGASYVWDVDPLSWVEKACQRAGRNFTQAEWRQYFPSEPYRLTCLQWPAGG